MSWYFCPLHQVYHAIGCRIPVEQPTCGECAAIFFYRSPAAVWARHEDLVARRSSTNNVTRNAIARLQELVREVPETDAILPMVLPDDILDEMPIHDPTYTTIDGELTGSKSAPGIQLCQFRTFQGGLGLQPCFEDSGYGVMFDALLPLEVNKDDIFREARIWACMNQSKPNLPLPCRWLLATVYNFACDVLRFHKDEAHCFRMRAWLHHWYDVADRLAVRLNVELCVPEPDWFGRQHTFRKDDSASESLREMTGTTLQGERYVEHSSSSGETVVRSAPETFDFRLNHIDSPTIPISNALHPT